MLKKLGLGAIILLGLEAGGAYAFLQHGGVEFVDTFLATPQEASVQRPEVGLEAVSISPIQYLASSDSHGYTFVALTLTNQSNLPLQTVSVKARFVAQDGSELGVREFVPLIAAIDKAILVPGESYTAQEMLLNIPSDWGDARISLSVATVIPSVSMDR